MIPYVSFFSLLNDPNSSLAVWYTLIPFWSPIATPVRWGATPIPVMELVASIAILLVMVVLVTWVACLALLPVLGGRFYSPQSAKEGPLFRWQILIRGFYTH